MKKFMNLTPHDVTLVKGSERVVLPATGITVRAAERKTVKGSEDINGLDIPVYGQLDYAEPTILDGTTPVPVEEFVTIFPEQKFIVSRIAYDSLKQYCPQYADRFFVVSDPVRDDKGNIVGAASLAQP